MAPGAVAAVLEVVLGTAAAGAAAVVAAVLDSCKLFVDRGNRFKGCMCLGAVQGVGVLMLLLFCLQPGDGTLPSAWVVIHGAEVIHSSSTHK